MKNEELALEFTMTIEPSITPVPPKERIATYLYFSSLYFISLGVLHLWGYWTTFNINILEYLNLTDIIKLTAYPVVTALIATALGGVLGTAMGRAEAARGKPSEDSLSVKALLGIRKYPKAVLTIYIFSIVLFVSFAPTWKWTVLPVFLAAPLVPYLINFPLIEKILPDIHARIFITLCLVVMLPTAYGTGRSRAERILSGERFQYVVSIVEGVNSSAYMAESERLRYLGHAGDVLFFRDPKEVATVIAKFESGRTLILKNFEKKDEWFFSNFFGK